MRSFAEIMNTSVNRLKWLALLLALVMGLISCGGGGGGGGAPAVLPPNITWVSGVPYVGGTGAASSATYTPPVTQASASVYIDQQGPGGASSVNQLFTTIKVCVPGTSNCQVIDHIVVDTGSVGLRLFSSTLSSGQTFPAVRNAAGMPSFSCVRFLDLTNLWGAVVSADVTLGNQTASNLSMQVMDPTFASLETGNCPGNTMGSPTVMGANGIIGVGLMKQDCGVGCTPANGTAANGSYYACTSQSCTSVAGTTLAAASQLQNAVSMFASNNDGLAVQLTSVTNPVATANGSLLFGSTNPAVTLALPAMTKLNLASSWNGYMILSFASASTWFAPSSPVNAYSSSFLDTGSNGLYFSGNASMLPTCASMAYFYCPAGTVSVTGMTMNGSSSGTKTISGTAFQIANVTGMNLSYAVQPMLGGPIGAGADPNMFDLGLPFFYGRTIFIGFETNSSTYSGSYYGL